MIERSILALFEFAADQRHGALLLRLFGLIGILVLTGCRSALTNLSVSSDGPDFRSFPISFSANEVLTRTWIKGADERIQLLHQEVFKLRVPESLDVLVTIFGNAVSNRAESIDFYVGQPMVTGETNYCLLFHDQNPPAFNLTIRYEEQNKRSFFTVEGQDQVSSSKKAWRMYYYSLNQRCYLHRHASNWFGPPVE